MIKFDKLFAKLEAEGKSAVYFLRKEGVHPAVMNKLRKNEGVNTSTINLLCDKLDCQPGDIMEFVKEE